MQTIKNSKKTIIFAVVIIMALVVSACSGAATPAPTQDVSSIQTQAAQDVLTQLTLSARLHRPRHRPPRLYRLKHCRPRVPPPTRISRWQSFPPPLLAGLQPSRTSIRSSTAALARITLSMPPSWVEQLPRSMVKVKTACGGRSAYRLPPPDRAGWRPVG